MKHFIEAPLLSNDVSEREEDQMRSVPTSRCRPTSRSQRTAPRTMKLRYVVASAEARRRGGADAVVRWNARGTSVAIRFTGSCLLRAGSG